MHKHMKKGYIEVNSKFSIIFDIALYYLNNYV